MEIVFGVVAVLVLLLIIINSAKGNSDEKDYLQRQLGESRKENFNLSTENKNLKSENDKLKNSIDLLMRKELSQNEWIKKREIIEDDFIRKREIIQAEWEKSQIKIKNNLLQEINDSLNQREKAYKWIAPIIADVKLFLRESSRTSDELITTKRTYLTNARVNILVNEQKKLLEENTVLKYQIEYIKTLIPETEDIVEYDEDKSEKENADNPSEYLSKEEYNMLSDTEKNIRALEHYKKRSKKNWEIGRDFERYIGYEFEKGGCEVEYFGIEKKLNDLGRDLIVRDNDTTLIIQCKYWSKQKTIHEKHIAQLFGTTVKYSIDHPNEKEVRGLFVSHTQLSEEAKEFTRVLSKVLPINIKENIELGEYPLIKCNNGHDKDGYETKIYHLPMDQQYDTTKINKKNGDFYAYTILEAEEKGYRRAYRWHGGQ